MQMRDALSWARQQSEHASPEQRKYHTAPSLHAYDSKHSPREDSVPPGEKEEKRTQTFSSQTEQQTGTPPPPPSMRQCSHTKEKFEVVFETHDPHPCVCPKCRPHTPPIRVQDYARASRSPGASQLSSFEHQKRLKQKLQDYLRAWAYNNSNWDASLDDEAARSVRVANASTQTVVDCSTQTSDHESLNTHDKKKGPNEPTSTLKRPTLAIPARTDSHRRSFSDSCAPRLPPSVNPTYHQYPTANSSLSISSSQSISHPTPFTVQHSVPMMIPTQHISSPNLSIYRSPSPHLGHEMRYASSYSNSYTPTCPPSPPGAAHSFSHSHTRDQHQRSRSDSQASNTSEAIKALRQVHALTANFVKVHKEPDTSFAKAYKDSDVDTKPEKLEKVDKPRRIPVSSPQPLSPRRYVPGSTPPGSPRRSHLSESLDDIEEEILRLRRRAKDIERHFFGIEQRIRAPAPGPVQMMFGSESGADSTSSLDEESEEADVLQLEEPEEPARKFSFQTPRKPSHIHKSSSEDSVSPSSPDRMKYVQIQSAPHRSAFSFSLNS